MSSRSAEIIGCSEDLLGKIFVDVPVISLTRFKSVSKQWRALISNLHFRLRHALENPSSRIPTGLFLCTKPYGQYSIFSISLSEFGGNIPSCSVLVNGLDDVPIIIDDYPIKLMDFLPENNVMEMIQSCNGLSFFKLDTPHRVFRFLYCVGNLATNQLKFVPLPNIDVSGCIGNCALAFDPSVSAYYKVICVVQEENFRQKFVVFSSETGQWKDANVTPKGRCFLDEYYRAVYCYGSIYYVPDRRSKSRCYRFDIEAESLTKFYVPEKAQNSYLRHFGEFNEHLYVVSVRHEAAKKINILELDHLTMKWFIKYRVQISGLISSFPQIIVTGKYNRSRYSFSILNVVRGEKEEDSALVMTIPGKVISYNFKSKKVEVVSDQLPWEERNIDLGEYVHVYRVTADAYPFAATLYPLE